MIQFFEIAWVQSTVHFFQQANLKGTHEKFSTKDQSN